MAEYAGSKVLVIAFTCNHCPTAQLYGIRPDAGFALALDVGSEFVRGAIADIRGAVRARGSRNVHAASLAALGSRFGLPFPS